MRRALPLAAFALAAVTITACGAGGSRPSSTTTVTRTDTVPPTADATAPIVAGPTSTSTAACPFLAQSAAQDILGQRLDHTTVQTSGGSPVGCLFYPITGALAVSEHLPTGGNPSIKVVVTTFVSDVAAHNALAAAATAGGAPSLVTVAGGLVGETYQGAFYPPDGPSDWICGFLKGAKLITVWTANVDNQQAVLALANALAGAV